MNLYARLHHLAQYQPARTAVETAKARLSYAEFELLTRRIAGELRRLGVGKGDVVGIRMRETPENMATMFAVMRLGAIMLPLDWRGTQAEFSRIAERFQPKAVVNDDNPALDWFSPILRTQSFASLAADDGPVADVVDAPLIYSLTSGTTGEPKAMIVTQEQLLARVCNRAIGDMFLPSDKFLNTLPLAYTAGREHAISAMLAGGTLALFPVLFQPGELVAFVSDRGVTALNLSPNMSRALIGARRTDGTLLLPDLRVLISTTGKLQPEDRANLRKFVTPRLIDYYGSTAAGTIAILDREEDEHDPTAVGRPAIAMDVEVADENGVSVRDGEFGRIRVRGPAVAMPMAGQVGSDEEGFRDGWFYPGDLGVMMPNGVLHLHGRAADLIKRGGLMVHAQEVEQALRRHPSVADVAVVGAPSVELGQEVVAFIVAKSPVEPKELTRHSRQEVAPFKIPSRFVFVETLPRNANGKVTKNELLKTL
jgi:acyl-coenzyme A synthetase/AMP-(fatty) acid ligase